MEWEFRSRLDRAFQQRIYMMNAERPPEEPDVFEFMVMGATGKPYNITIQNHRGVHCSCFDHTKNHKLCKHILFMLIRVLKLARQEIYEKYFLKNSFFCTPKTFQKCVEFIESTQCKNLIGKYDNQGNVQQRKIDEEDCCPICFEDFVEKESIVYCKSSCGKSVHQSCFVKWANIKGGTCVYCRAQWIW